MPESSEVGAVTRVDKFGRTMPILRPTFLVPGSKAVHFRVEHEGNLMGHVFQPTRDGPWFSRRHTGEGFGPYQHRHEAVHGLYGPAQGGTLV
jgi:hypothetical protein